MFTCIGTVHETIFLPLYRQYIGHDMVTNDV
jgi:hypothetical protein